MQCCRICGLNILLSHGRPDFDQVAVRIIEAYHLLSPAVGHQTVHIGDIRIQTLQLPDKAFYVLFLKIEFTGIIFRCDFFSQVCSS